MENAVDAGGISHFYFVGETGWVCSLRVFSCCLRGREVRASVGCYVL